MTLTVESHTGRRDESSPCNAEKPPVLGSVIILWIIDHITREKNSLYGDEEKQFINVNKSSNKTSRRTYSDKLNNYECNYD